MTSSDSRTAGNIGLSCHNDQTVGISLENTSSITTLIFEDQEKPFHRGLHLVVSQVIIIINM